MGLAETSNLLYGCRKSSDGSVDITGIKNQVFVYGLPPSEQADLKELSPAFVTSPSPVETALNVHNVPLHCPITATNLGAILAGRMERFYGDGLGAEAVATIEAVEEERQALCRAYGVRCSTLFELFHEVQARSLADLLRQRLGSSAIPPPDRLDHRYYVEDIRFGLIPMIDLADIAGVRVPCLRGALERLLPAADWLDGARRIGADHVTGWAA